MNLGNDKDDFWEWLETKEQNLWLKTKEHNNQPKIPSIFFILYGFFLGFISSAIIFFIANFS